MVHLKEIVPLKLCSNKEAVHGFHFPLGFIAIYNSSVEFSLVEQLKLLCHRAVTALRSPPIYTTRLQWKYVSVDSHCKWL